ncbi:mediator of RNA polymerase II transcription subunit 11-like isoform X2 [Uloborus diversus]|uniref:mediator of RNA polymerase II transcription subunit 11-like isoform X2 n=1 Tax=Uloborus diversus TaxID=327109 RepID=UPI00240A1934|nr:mediator of RNA polymerase II transcription subunit 11-like isoform X2 [Uloborus diversus]
MSTGHLKLMATPNDKLKQLEGLEKDLAAALHAASQAVLELSKEKPSVKQAETYSSTFLKTLENVENGQAHEGSSYASQKMMQMAWHRFKHTQSKLIELERLKVQHAQEDTRKNMHRQFPPST